MDNHAHFIIDANGADISKIMHGINFTYAQRFNRRYGRHGHLFQDRFKSKIVTSDGYLFVLSAYIHNNAVDIRKYRKYPERYMYSSLAVYLGLRSDPFEILDEAFIMQMFGSSVEEAREAYLAFVYKCNDRKFKTTVEFKDEKTVYKSERTILIRNSSPDEILHYIAEKMGVNPIMLHMKNSKGTTEGKALSVLMMRKYCNFRCSDICRVLEGITQTRVSQLCSMGLKMIVEEPRYRSIVEGFIKGRAA
jgi:hypothetical protein